MIAAAIVDVEATHVVRVYLDDRVCVDVKIIGLCGWKQVDDVGGASSVVGLGLVE